MKNINLIITGILLLVFSSCRKGDLISDDEIIIDNADYADWTEETHGENAPLNFDVVFNQNEVLRFDIVIDSNDWAHMQADLAANISSTGGGPGGGGPGGGGPGGQTTVSEYVPIWVPCSFQFNDKEWYHVGIRFKGNSSLQSTYLSGNSKLSFKLDFDEFEDDYPAIKNQRFYGFKQLNLKNNYNDESLIREKVGADLFRQFGLASSQTAFCVVYVDYGSGPQYYGVYTLVEEVDDSVIKTQFAQSTGNLYKPDGTAATFANGSYNTSQMELKTNEELADYSDVLALYDAINSSLRTTDVETWKTNLESVFNVDVFLKYLAANNTIQNWDSYGLMPHNYYLYNNPDNGLLTWIPWDNNEAFQEGNNGGALSLSMSEVGSDWPLINYIIAQPEYEATYKAFLQKFITEVFVPTNMINTYTAYHELLKEYAYVEQSGCTFISSDAAFDNAIETLKTHVQSRNDAVNSYLQ